MASLIKIIDQLSQLVGTEKLNEVDTNFVKDVAFKTNDGLAVHELDENELQRVREVWHKVK